MCCKVLRCTSDVKINAKHEFHACFYAWWYGKNSLFCPFFSQIYLISCNIFFSFFSYFSSIFFSEKRKNIFFGKKEKENFPWNVYWVGKMNQRNSMPCFFINGVGAMVFMFIGTSIPQYNSTYVGVNQALFLYTLRKTQVGLKLRFSTKLRSQKCKNIRRPQNTSSSIKLGHKIQSHFSAGLVQSPEYMVFCVPGTIFS